MSSGAADGTARQFEVTWSQAALKTLRKLDNPTRERLVKAAQLLSGNPHPPAAKRLTGTSSTASTFRIRTGDWRLLYTVQDRKLIVLIVKVGHRGEVYRSI